MKFPSRPRASSPGSPAVGLRFLSVLITQSVFPPPRKKRVVKSVPLKSTRETRKHILKQMGLFLKTIREMAVCEGSHFPKQKLISRWWRPLTDGHVWRFQKEKRRKLRFTPLKKKPDTYFLGSDPTPPFPGNGRNNKTNKQNCFCRTTPAFFSASSTKFQHEVVGDPQIQDLHHGGRANFTPPPPPLSDLAT